MKKQTFMLSLISLTALLFFSGCSPEALTYWSDQQMNIVVSSPLMTASSQSKLKLIDPSAFNERIKAAEQTSDTWIYHPVITSLLFIAYQDDNAIVINHQEQISMKSVRDSSLDRAVVTIERSGFRDDSVGGDKFVITLERQRTNVLPNPNGWLIKSVQHGWRCQRGENQVNYTNELCP